MRHLNEIRGLALLALFSIGMFSTATANAEVKTAELLPAPGAEATKVSVRGGKGKLVTVNGFEVKCTGFSGSGQFTSASLGTGELVFTGCESEGVKCKSTEQTGGTIATPLLNLLLVSFTEATNLLLGLLISVELGHSVTFSCGVLHVEVKGSIIAEVTQLRENSKTETLKQVPMPAEGTKELILAVLIQLFLGQEKGKPKPNSDHLETTINGATFLESGLLSEESVTMVFEKPEKVHIDY